MTFRLSTQKRRSLRRHRHSSRKRRSIGLGLIVVAFFSIYIGCGPGFIGKSTKKPTPKRQQTERISPDEIEEPGDRIAGNTAVPNTTVVASGQGSVSGGPNISLSVIQADSESWWKNCLYARVQNSTAWVPVSCNKKAAGFPESGRVSLPASENTCNIVEIKIDTFKNLGETCNERRMRGLSCEGPYPQTADATRVPAAGSQNNFRVYDSTNVTNPDRLILANANWQLPDFTKLQNDMRAFRSATNRNQWIRVFFEDKSASSIAAAQSSPSAKSLGVDFNDYVFDIKSENVDFSLAGTSISCRP